MTAEEIADHRAKRYNATVSHLHKIHTDLMVIRVKPDFPRPAYQPGQYCTLGLGNWEPRVEGCQDEGLQPTDLEKVVRRSYSIGNSIYDETGNLRDMDADEYIEFYIVLVRESTDGGRVPVLTPRLFALKEGDRVAIGPKITGHFTVEPVKPGDNVVFLSTGTGEAPHNSMLWELLRRGHAGKMLGACCVRLKKDLGFLDTHARVSEQFPNYTYIGLATREPGSTGKKYIQDLITSGELEDRLGAPLDPANTHVFLCGNPMMIGVPFKDKETGARHYPEPLGVIEILERRGFQADNAAAKFKGNVHFEEYW